MPTLRIPPDLDLHYVVDDYTDPWGKAETVLLLHGNAESGAAWYGWVPHLGRRFRLVRPDMRGYGEIHTTWRRATRSVARVKLWSSSPVTAHGRKREFCQVDRSSARPAYVLTDRAARTMDIRYDPVSARERARTMLPRHALKGEQGTWHFEES